MMAIKKIQFSADGGVSYKNLVAFETIEESTSGVYPVFKYLGEHYGFLVFVDKSGGTLTFKTDSTKEKESLIVGNEYEFKIPVTE